MLHEYRISSAPGKKKLITFNIVCSLVSGLWCFMKPGFASRNPTTETARRVEHGDLCVSHIFIQRFHDLGTSKLPITWWKMMGNDKKSEKFEMEKIQKIQKGLYIHAIPKCGISVFFWGGWPYLITTLICKYQLITCFGWSIFPWIGSPRAWFLTEKMVEKIPWKAENVHDFNQRFQIPYYLVVEPTRLKNMRVKMDHETPRIGLNIKNIWVVTSQHWFPHDFHLWFPSLHLHPHFKALKKTRAWTASHCRPYPRPETWPEPGSLGFKIQGWVFSPDFCNRMQLSFWYPKSPGNESTYPT